ncbi:MAG TPA: alpha/beta hydrolase [Pseudomonadales bacterium]|nr:alpha/beta hydrolase [Pseudomonadales bacterium]
MPSQEMQQVIALLEGQPNTLGTVTIEEQRAGMEAQLGSQPLPDGVTVDEIRIGAMTADWVTLPNSANGRVVLYLHGGGYVMGSKRTHRELASRIARDAAARVLVLEYRLAPEHPFPAAIDDATEAYRWLRKQGIAASSLAIAGDSAGGGLTLATLLKLRDAGDALPACAVLLSPWTDLEGTGASAQPGGADDPMIPLAALRDMGKLYAQQSTASALASPVHANFKGLPPLLIQVGTRELLLDDSMRVADKARAAGVPVRLEVEDGAFHVWQAMPGLPEAVAAVKRIGAFVRERIPA